eukprot:jgi/Chlat1/4221/Chrsp27S08881
MRAGYGFLSRSISGSSLSSTLFRLSLDQLLFAPCFIAVFFSALLTLEGRPDQIRAKLRSDWKEAVVTNWKIWVPFQFVNFGFVKPQLQVAAANVVAVVWNAYLSFATHK